MDDGDEPIDPGHVWVELGSCRQQREPDQERSHCANLLYGRKTTVSREKPFQPGWIYSTVTDPSNWKPPFDVFRIDPCLFHPYPTGESRDLLSRQQRDASSSVIAAYCMYAACL